LNYVIGFLKGYVLPIVIGIVVALLCRYYAFSMATVVSGSMLPTLPFPTRLFVDHVAVELHQPYRGEVVMFNAPPNTTAESPLLKRIIGLPGETVLVQDGGVYINGKRLSEPYLKNIVTQGTAGPFKVPPGEYFMMGDNRNDSYDSRFWKNHFVPKKDLIGRIDAILWPPVDARIVH